MAVTFRKPRFRKRWQSLSRNHVFESDGNLIVSQFREQDPILSYVPPRMMQSPYASKYQNQSAFLLEKSLYGVNMGLALPYVKQSLCLCLIT